MSQEPSDAAGAPRADKVAIVDEVAEKLGASSAVFVTEYRGLSVSQMADLRAPLREAGADIVGADDLAADVEAGNMDFDLVIAAPDMMPLVGRLGRTLGPRGLMPNPKTGTVTPDVGRAVGEFKGGKVEYRTDRYGNVHVPLGKASFEPAALAQNFFAVLDELNRAKPASAKGRYVRKVTVSSTMGPGVRVDTGRLKVEA